MEADRRPAVVGDLIAAVAGKYGRQALQRGEEGQSLGPPDAISTQCLSLDLALGTGGVPRGRVVEIFGEQGSGKTTLALHVVCAAQRDDLVAAWVDADLRFNREYARAIGVNVDHLALSQPRSGEDGLQAVERLVRLGGVAVVVIDSVQGLVPYGPPGSLDPERILSQDLPIPLSRAQLMGQALRRLRAAAHRNSTCLLFTNPLRRRGEGSRWSETTSGGLALGCFATQRIRLERVAEVRKWGERVAEMCQATIVKNQAAVPLRVAEMELLYGRGLNSVEDLLQVALEAQVIEHASGGFTLNTERLGWSWDEVLANLAADADQMARVAAVVYQRLRVRPPPALAKRAAGLHKDEKD